MTAHIDKQACLLEPGGQNMNKEEKKVTEEATEEVKETPESQSEEVSDEELEAVSGGKFGIRDKNRTDS